jgi:hypothetical protein
MPDNFFRQCTEAFILKKKWDNVVSVSKAVKTKGQTKTRFGSV